MIKVEINLDGRKRTINGDGQHIKGSITQEIGAINSFEFEIYPQNIGFDLIQSRKTLVKATNTVTGRVEFAGRVLLAEQKMENNGVISKRVTCESYLGYLYDSVQPFAEEATMPLRDFLQLVLNNHNACVESSKQMQLGTVNVEVAGTGNVTKGLQYETTYDTIKSKLVDIYGGELEVVENEDGLTLNYVKQIGTTRATTIELGLNMQQASREVSPLEIITRLIPLGAKLKKKETDAEGNETEVETGERLSLVGYTPAGKDTMTVPWIDDEEKHGECGVVCGRLEFDDVTEQSNLYNKALEYMKTKNLVALSHTLTALDLKEIGQAIDGLNCGDSYPVKNKLIGLDEVLRITKKTIDINAPYKSSITIGEKRATLSSIQADTNATIGELFGTIQAITKTANNLKEYVSSTEKSVNALASKVEGIDGTYFYIRYSPYSDGRVMTDKPEPDTEYMGVCSTNESEAPKEYTKYTWAKIKGETGADGKQGLQGSRGDNGLTSYLHVKYSDDGKTFTGNLTPADISQWTYGVPPTTSGTIESEIDAANSGAITFKNVLPVTPATTLRLTAHNTAMFILINYGADGAFLSNKILTGGSDYGYTVPSDVYYLRVVMADSNAECDFSQYTEAFVTGELIPEIRDTAETNAGETLGAWIGTYVDFIEADSNDPTAYKWVKFTADVDEDLKGIKETITLLNTELVNTAQEIAMLAERDYIERDEYKEFKEHTESQLKQTADNITMEFSKTETLINNASEANSAEIASAFNELKSYIRYSMNDSGQPVIELGAATSPLICRILNDKIAFLDNGVEVAYLSNNQLYITDATILTSLNIGDFKVKPRTNGNLSIV